MARRANIAPLDACSRQNSDVGPDITGYGRLAEASFGAAPTLLPPLGESHDLINPLALGCWRPRRHAAVRPDWRERWLSDGDRFRGSAWTSVGIGQIPQVASGYHPRGLCLIYGCAMRSFQAGDVAGWVRTGAESRQVLLLHGGPGVPFGYMAGLADALPGWTCATFQQRGRRPSTTDGPFDIPTAIVDVREVLDHLGESGWDRPFVAGHSWGGHLAWHVAVTLGDRVAGVLAIDPLGVVGDMGVAAYEAELRRRVLTRHQDRLAELDDLADDGGLTADEGREMGGLLWPGLFAHPDDMLPFPDVEPNRRVFDDLSESARSHRHDLERSLPSVTVPVGAVVGSASPFPASAARQATALVPGGWSQVVDGAGHFVWHERPDAIGVALSRLTDGRHRT